jgi:Uma2 family endonuclease
MAVQLETRQMNVEEFERWIALAENSGRLFELIDGEIVEKMPTEEHGEVQGWFTTVLTLFVRERKLGRVSVEARHKMPQERRNSYLPDISFIAGKRPRVKQGSIPQMPDLAVEIMSPDDGLKEVRAKALYYLANGTQLVLILDPAKRLVIRLTPDDEHILLADDTLDCAPVLAGFTIRVNEIFADPLTEEEAVS